MMNVNNRWFQLGASLVAMIMIANLQYAWTLFVNPLREGNGWTLADVQWAFTLFILCQTWVQPLDGWLIDRLGPRYFITAAGVLCGCGWAGMGYATSVPMLYVLYALAGTGAAFVYSGCIGSALKWFQDRRGFAAGIIAAGFGGGTALFIPLISSLIANQGYRAAFFWTGILQGLVILVVAQFLRHPAHAAVAAAARSGTGAARPQYTTAEMVRTPHFYVMYAMFVMMSIGGLMVTAQAGPIAKVWGLSTAALTLAASLSPVANGASRVFWGWASDRLGREKSMIIAFVLQAIALLLVLGVGHLSAAWFAATLVFVYFTWGEIYSLFPSLTGDYFGARHATSNYAVMYTAKGAASIVGGGLAAMLFERFGSWSAAFYGSAALALVAAGLAVGLRAVGAPARRDHPLPVVSS
ncbi:MAG: oxalate/formate MFS antiporter [Acidobacteria bacterium]|nr:oxalate/formate MFS antiporter [Acidobacteriota bacterium]